jgi:phage-related protein
MRHYHPSITALHLNERCHFVLYSTPDVKNFLSSPHGVLEVVEEHSGGTYRAVYTVKFAGVVYVLHAFQKKSTRGIATPKRDIDLIQARLRWAQEHYPTWSEQQKK